jgi:transposase
MLSFSGSLKVFVAVEPCDMRRSFNGLHDAVSTKLKEDPKSGAIFAFTNKRRSLLKILYWDGSGLWVLAKRLERGTFAWPKGAEIKDGKLRAMAVLLPARWSLLPNVPTGAEAGLPPFTAGTWAALFGPAKLPADIAQKMNRALNDALGKPDVREKIAALGFELAGSTPDEMGKFLQEQLVAWAKAFKDAGMQPE